jgi:hypothetical protein
LEVAKSAAAADLHAQTRREAQLIEGLKAATTPTQPFPTQAAVKAAQDNNTRMILQNLLN